MRTCLVFNCQSREEKGGKISFFRFPVDRPKLLQKWLKILGRNYIYDINRSFLCSKHFNEDDFKPWTKIRRLKDDAVPSKLQFPSENLIKNTKSKQMESDTEDKDRTVDSAEETKILCIQSKIQP